MITQKPLFYVFALLLCYISSFTSAQSNPRFAQAVIDDMSTRESRYHHFLWHNIRDNWNRFDEATQEEIRKRRWEPPRPARSYDANGNPTAIIDNNSGQDFLYMHRQMITRVRSLVGNNSDALDQLSGWTSIPGPSSTLWPVPPEYEIGGSPSTTTSINNRKTDDFYNDQMVPIEDMFTDPDELRSMTLGELGSRIENTIHNWMHLRWSAESTYGYRPGTSAAFPLIDETWDDPDYTWMGDTYSSHVNPVFWKLHGWVDDRIEDWRVANGIDEIEWIGTWEGGSMSGIMDILAGEPAEGTESRAFGDSLTVRSSTEAAAGPTEVASPFAEDVQVDLGTSGKAIAPSVVSTSNVNSKPKVRKCKSRFRSLSRNR